jgi:hypothetical protein
MEAMLARMKADDNVTWHSVDLGKAAHLYETFNQELEKMAKDLGLQINTDRRGQILLATITGRKRK